MAEVFLAERDDGLTGPLGQRKQVALKRLQPQLGRDPQMRAMLFEEARLSAGLHHENLVEAYDVGEDEAGCFFTMELVRGHELRHVVRRVAGKDERLEVGHVVSIVAGVAAGLQYAHDKRAPTGQRLGIVHLDVCPSNVLLTAEGYVKLIDFGIARSVYTSSPREQETEWGSCPAPSDTSVRRGTLAYMSPEQVQGFAVDRRSDVFSLGVMLWELTTWRRLFRAPSQQEVFHRIVHEPAPAPSTVVPDYDPELEAIVMRALARDPAQRYASATELAEVLEDYAFARAMKVSRRHLGALVGRLFGPVSHAQPPDRQLDAFAKRFQPIARRWASTPASPEPEG